ncbi:hypothetical protein M0811_11294 [Anaeramoeba ignava]|uniref:Uncharacterized protein n=1 Tax=Anaeramoeba ignava TaxID=1746090 RepID=A0A9Q0LCU4_ANAIG|nr:hypothetical protein M0811_11294 [Anaeramoeba ignava]
MKMKKKGTIFCQIFNLNPEEPLNIIKIMKEILEFSTSDSNQQITILFNSWNLNENKILDKDQLDKLIQDIYFLINCLEFKKFVGNINDYIENLNQEYKDKFYKGIQQLFPKKEIDEKIDNLFKYLNLKEDEGINLKNFQEYCDKNPENFVIEFLNAIKLLIELEEEKEKYIEKLKEEKEDYEKRIKNLEQKLDQILNIPSPKKGDIVEFQFYKGFYINFEKRLILHQVDITETIFGSPSKNLKGKIINYEEKEVKFDNYCWPKCSKYYEVYCKSLNK